VGSLRSSSPFGCFSISSSVASIDGMGRGVRLVAVEPVVEEAQADLSSPLFELAPVIGLSVSKFGRELHATGGNRFAFLALLGRERFHSGVIQCRCVLPKPLSPQVAGGMVVCHPEFPVAVWAVCEPALADEEFQHRTQWADRFQHLSCVGERIRGAEKPALASNETDNRAAIGREPSTPQAPSYLGITKPS